MSQELIARFSKLPDPRRDHRKFYQLSHLLFLTTMAVIAGCNTCLEVESFGVARIEWLQSLGIFPHGAPSHDTIGRILRLLEPRHFQDLFAEWVEKIIGPVSGVLAIDGKTSRGSRDGDKRMPLHTVSVYACEAGVTLAHIDVGDKSNEIPAIPEVIKSLEISGTIVTVDAMGCQMDIVEAIRGKGADYLLAVKGNQRNLHDKIKDHFVNCTTKKWKRDNEFTYSTTNNKGHGRTEFREAWCCPVPNGLIDENKWMDVAQVVCNRSTRILDGAITIEDRHYITSSKRAAQYILRSIRKHWGIENKVHWVLDVTFSEDKCTIRKDHGPMNISTIRRWALNILRVQPSKKSMNIRRKMAGFSTPFLESIILGINGIVLEK